MEKICRKCGGKIIGSVQVFGMYPNYEYEHIKCPKKPKARSQK